MYFFKRIKTHIHTERNTYCQPSKVHDISIVLRASLCLGTYIYWKPDFRVSIYFSCKLNTLIENRRCRLTWWMTTHTGSVDTAKGVRSEINFAYCYLHHLGKASVSHVQRGNNNAFLQFWALSNQSDISLPFQFLHIDCCALRKNYTPLQIYLLSPQMHPKGYSTILHISLVSYLSYVQSIHSKF